MQELRRLLKVLTKLKVVCGRAQVMVRVFQAFWCIVSLSELLKVLCVTLC